MGKMAGWLFVLQHEVKIMLITTVLLIAHFLLNELEQSHENGQTWVTWGGIYSARTFHRQNMGLVDYDHANISGVTAVQYS